MKYLILPFHVLVRFAVDVNSVLVHCWIVPSPDCVHC